MNSIFGKIVVVAIVCGMAFWGVDQMFAQIRGGLGANLAQAGGRGVDAAALDERIENVLRRMNATNPEPLSKEAALEQGIIDEVFAIESARITALGFAQQIGVKASPEHVVETLKALDDFKNPLTGEMDMNTYREVLRRNNVSERSFEGQVADDLVLTSLQAAATGAVVAPQSLAGFEVLYLGEKRDAAWFFYAPLANIAIADPTPEEVTAYYNDNIAALRQPKRRSIDLIRMSPEDFMSDVQVTDQEVATVYESAKSGRFSEPDQRTYAELYFATRDDARAAFGLLAGGADPSSVPGTASTNIKTGRADSVADPLLREAMFGAGRQSGALFGPAERDGRWLVARLVSVQPGAVMPLEAVAEQIRTELAMERAQVVFGEKLEALDEKIAAGYEMDVIAREIGVPVLSFLPVDENGVTEAGQQMTALVEAGNAFKQAFAVSQGEISGRYDGEGEVFIAAPESTIPASTPALEAIETKVRASLIAEKREVEAQRRVTELTDRLKAKTIELDAAAAEVGVPVDRLPQPVTRLSAEQMRLPPPIMNAIFRGRSGDAVSFPAGPDQFVILQIGAVTPPAPETVAALGAEATANLTNALRADIESALTGEFGKAIKLKTNANALNAYKSSIRSSQ